MIYINTKTGAEISTDCEIIGDDWKKKSKKNSTKDKLKTSKGNASDNPDGKDGPDNTDGKDGPDNTDGEDGPDTHEEGDGNE